MTNAIYLFGVMSAATNLDPAALPSLIPGLHAELVSTDGLCAVGVALPAFAKTQLEQILAHPDQAPELLIAHDRMIHALFAQGSILPSRFGMTLSCADAVRAWLADDAAALHARLAAVAGAGEWCLKIKTSGDQPPKPQAPVTPSSPRPVGGAQFLKRKLSAKRAVEDGAQNRRQAVQALHAACTALAREHRVAAADPLKDWRFRGHYLIDHRQKPQLTAIAQSQQAGLAALGLTLDLQGPLPAYSFCAAPNTGAADAAQHAAIAA